MSIILSASEPSVDRVVHLDTAAWAAGIQRAATRRQASGHHQLIVGWTFLGLTVFLSVAIAMTQENMSGGAAILLPLVLVPPALGLLNLALVWWQQRRHPARVATLMRMLAAQEPYPVAMRLRVEGIVLCAVPGECGPLIPWGAVRSCRRSGRMVSIRFDRVAWPEGRGRVSYNTRYLAENPDTVIEAIRGGIASA